MKSLILSLSFLICLPLNADQCFIKLEDLIKQPLNLSGLTLTRNAEYRLSHLQFTHEKFEEILKHTFSEPVTDKTNKRDYQSRHFVLAHNDGETYHGGAVYKVVFSEDLDTKIRTVEHIEIASDGSQAAYFHALAEKKNTRDFLGVSLQPIMGMQSVKIEKGNLLKMRYKHELLPREIIEGFNNYDSRFPIEEKKKERNNYFILHSTNKTGQILKIVFVIENNQIVVISAYVENRILH